MECEALHFQLFDPANPPGHMQDCFVVRRESDTPDHWWWDAHWAKGEGKFRQGAALLSSNKVFWCPLPRVILTVRSINQTFAAPSSKEMF